MSCHLHLVKCTVLEIRHHGLRFRFPIFQFHVRRFPSPSRPRNPDAGAASRSRKTTALGRKACGTSCGKPKSSFFPSASFTSLLEKVRKRDVEPEVYVIYENFRRAQSVFREFQGASSSVLALWVFQVCSERLRAFVLAL